MSQFVTPLRCPMTVVNSDGHSDLLHYSMVMTAHIMDSHFQSSYPRSKRGCIHRHIPSLITTVFVVLSLPRFSHNGGSLNRPPRIAELPLFEIRVALIFCITALNTEYNIISRRKNAHTVLEIYPHGLCSCEGSTAALFSRKRKARTGLVHVFHSQ